MYYSSGGEELDVFMFFITIVIPFFIKYIIPFIILINLIIIRKFLKNINNKINSFNSIIKPN